MHVPRLAADERLINFNLSAGATNLNCGVFLQGLPDSLQHEPRRLLSNSERAMNLVTAHPVPAVDQHPRCRHPLIQPKCGVLKDRADLERELLLASVAEPKLPRLDERVLLGATAWTGHFAIGPAKLLRIFKRSVGVAEINDSLLKRKRFFHDV